jgi:hypothetical protein
MTLEPVFESEIEGLFTGTANQSFYYLRFCLSLPQLARSDEILENIPYLLTNKLPLFEFQKNELRFDDDQMPGQRI